MKIEEGICPICGHDRFDVTDSDHNEDGTTYICKCEKCGATFYECYDLEFAGYWNISDGDGKEYEDMYATTDTDKVRYIKECILNYTECYEGTPDECINKIIKILEGAE